MKIGTIDISTFKIGSASVSKVYIGSTQSWPITIDHPDIQINYIDLSTGQYFDLGWAPKDASIADNRYLGFDASIMLLENNLKTQIIDSTGSTSSYKSLGQVFESNQVRTNIGGSWPTNLYFTISPNTAIRYKWAIQQPHIEYGSSIDTWKTHLWYTGLSEARVSSSGNVGYDTYFSDNNMFIGGTNNANGGWRIYNLNFCDCNGIFQTDWSTWQFRWIHQYIPIRHYVNDAYVTCLKDTTTNTYVYHSGGGTLIYG